MHCIVTARDGVMLAARPVAVAVAGTARTCSFDVDLLPKRVSVPNLLE